MYTFSKEKTTKYMQQITTALFSCEGPFLAKYLSLYIGILSFRRFSGTINGAVNGDPNFLKCTKDLFHTSVPES
jgi:hypothetical protein